MTEEVARLRAAIEGFRIHGKRLLSSDDTVLDIESVLARNAALSAAAPLIAAQARKDALEEAAEIAKVTAGPLEMGDDDFMRGVKVAGRRIATAILSAGEKQT